ncbi:prepilin peptidase [Catenulispora sp. NF23]|uniref:Prepilin peptidase n=1 Tax=Catenulispora pinistramenti TaxID=2705254 RepID=A0ABS5L1L3_9ACTN|nr:A24 family peptidase [Catenulispora pinistramenti]MBS2535374.1 prepilin peptidase [Catenulispora pinistramenti]MBS2552222.1 prepilin peptidase [Catenulispora pinistramenti]
MDVAVVTALVGALSGPALARGAYQMSVDAGTPARQRCGHCCEPLPAGWARFGLWTGRCGHCRDALGPRIWLVAIAAAAAGFAVGLRLGNDPAVLTFLAFAFGGVLLAFIDLAVRRLPDQLTAPLAVLGLVGLSTTAYLNRDMTPVLRGLIAAALAGGLFLALALIRPDGDGMGLGDAKLAAVLGLYLGYLGWGDLTLGILAGSAAASVFGLVMLRTGRMDRKSALTYGPFLLLGALVAMLVG